MTGLAPITIYWYKVNSLNGGGESLNAVPIKVITKKIGGAEGDGGLTILDQPKTVNVNLYPNPAGAGQPIFVENGNSMETFNIEIVDMTGKTVLRFFDNKSVYAPQVKGIYFVKIITRQKTNVCKLIVE
jgi:hypothetical protein